MSSRRRLFLLSRYTLANLASVILNSVAELLSGSSDDLWNSDLWTTIRQDHETRRYWYEGKEWDKAIKGTANSDGEQELKYPLQSNPIAKMCRIHRAILMGMLDDTYSQVPIQTLVNRHKMATDAERQIAIDLESFISSVWWQNHGGSLQMESCLQEQYYGGHVFKINWEPFNETLPYRISISSLETPGYLLPVAWSTTNKFRLLECYIGYEIPATTAKLQFGITAKDKNANTVVYLEHWTEEDYKITVDGQVPEFEFANGEIYRQEGKNPWNMVPVIYIPHERDGGYYGRSLVNGDSPLIGLAKERNARMADRGDLVRESRDIPWVANTRNESMVLRWVDFEDGSSAPVLDIGGTGLPQSPTPEMGIVRIGGPSKEAKDYDDDVLAEMMSQADVTPVAFGLDDTASGRITGPVTAYRMWPSMQHTMAERSFYSEGMIELAKMILKIGQWATKESEWAKARVSSPPSLTPEMSTMEFGIHWRPMIPMEGEVRSRILNERLANGGISIHDYLIQQGSPNPEEEEARIWADREKQASIEAQKQAEMLAARLEAMNSGYNDDRAGRQQDE